VTNNMYTPPSSSESDDTIARSTLQPPKNVSMGRGASWLAEGYRLFTKAPLAWLGITLIWGVLSGISVTIPLSGNVLQPLLMAGVATACWRLDTTGVLNIEDIFSGFKQQTGALVLIGAISVAATILLIIAAILLGVTSLLSMAEMSPAAIESGAANGEIMALLILLLIGATIMTPLIMAIWFAPLLIMLHNEPTLNAMKLSFKACLLNILPFTVYTIAIIPLMLLATIPLFLGYLILIPVIMGSIYTSYKDIFLAVD